jgi:hypothetical protein
MDIQKERQALLQKELEQYEKETPMTDEERELLREWVVDGNSFHDNGWYAYGENGRPIDFLDAYRQVSAQAERMADMIDSAGGDHMNDGFSLGTTPFPSLTYYDQKKWIRELYRKYMLCREVIVMNDLRDEASDYIEQHWLDSTPFDVITDWL